MTKTSKTSSKTPKGINEGLLTLIMALVIGGLAVALIWPNILEFIHQSHLDLLFKVFGGG